MKTKIVLISIIAVLIAAFFIFDLKDYVSLEYLKSQQLALQSFYAERPYAIIVVYFLVYVAITSLSLPFATPLTVAAGAIFGNFLGVTLVSFASSIGATLAFLLARFLFHESVERKFGDKLVGINAGIEKEGAFYVFGLRLVPIFPFFIINLVLGLTRLRPWTFYWASQLGMLIGTIVYVNAGAQLASISSLSDIASPRLLASFAALGLLPILSKKLLGFLRRRWCRQEV